MTDSIEALHSLHTALVDSREGYEKALDLAEGRGLTPLFQELIAMRTRHAAALERHVVPAAGDGTSFMATVHRVVISVRALFSELDENILPGLIDGEKRIVGYYDDALAAAQANSLAHATLVQQRGEVLEIIHHMQVRDASADAASV